MKWVDACLGEKWEKRVVVFIGGDLVSPFFSLALSFLFPFSSLMGFLFYCVVRKPRHKEESRGETVKS